MYADISSGRYKSLEAKVSAHYNAIMFGMNNWKSFCVLAPNVTLGIQVVPNAALNFTQFQLGSSALSLCLPQPLSVYNFLVMLI